MLTFEQKLRSYARIALVYGLGLDQKARPLYVNSFQTEDHGGFIPILAEEAYKLGVETVDVVYRDPALERAQFLGAPEAFKLNISQHISMRAQEIVDQDGACLALNGNGSLGVMDDVDSKYPASLKAMQMKAYEPLTSRRMKMLQPWSILDVPTVAWAHKLGMSIDELWQFLFEVMGANEDDPVGYAVGVSDTLHKRAALLNAGGIHKLLFRGEGTNLNVGLSPHAKWLGGQKQAEDGTWFGANWGSFEIYTTPDWRTVEGTARITMPSVIGGQVVDGLTVDFQNGEVVDFRAEQGASAFENLISHDDGANQLGEIALVGLDSPLAQYREPHFCTMLDENKRCHMAVGKAYAAALNGGTKMSEDELANIGCNDSEVHHDMMISDETTSVFTIDENNNTVAQLMHGGHWLEPFDCKS